MELETTSTFDTKHSRLSGPITLLHKRSFAVGIDVGQAHDPTAICVAAKVVTTAMNPLFADLNPFPRPRYEVAHLERLRLGMPYPQQVDHTWKRC